MKTIKAKVKINHPQLAGVFDVEEVVTINVLNKLDYRIQSKNGDEYGPAFFNQIFGHATLDMIFEKLDSVPDFETGALTSEINDLVLYTDTTKVLAEFRDYLFKITSVRGQQLPSSFMSLFKRARNRYINEFDDTEVLSISQAQDYCNVYFARFLSWKKENGIP